MAWHVAYRKVAYYEVLSPRRSRRRVSIFRFGAWVAPLGRVGFVGGFYSFGVVWVAAFGAGFPFLPYAIFFSGVR